MRKRVVVTGLGAITPVGNDVPTMWENLVAGHSGIDHITRFDASELPVRIAAEVKGFDPEAIFGRREARRNDPVTLFAMEAARQAVADANLTLTDEEKQRAGAIIGTGIGGVLSLLINYDIINSAGPRRVSPFMIPMMMANAPVAAVSIIYGLQGPTMSVASACATGNNAIGEAMHIIRRDDADVMLCGGAEMVMHAVAIAGFSNMGAVSSRNDEPQRASRPFDAERDGFVMGEGASVFVLEELELAVSRGVTILGEVLGGGSNADAHHITAPSPGGIGAITCMRLALADAGLEPGDIAQVNAHGTSTPLGDKAESQAIKAVFGEHAHKIKISSTKGALGHSLGASGGIEAVILCKTLETATIAPTINYETPDPECDLDYTPNQSQSADVRVAMSNSFGFGGHNACVVFRKFT